jgi:hypothetical protein
VLAGADKTDDSLGLTPAQGSGQAAGLSENRPPDAESGSLLTADRSTATGHNTTR